MSGELIICPACRRRGRQPVPGRAIRCVCGATISPVGELIGVATPCRPDGAPYWTIAARRAACQSCEHHHNDRCDKIDLGCRRTFLDALSAVTPRCPENCWGPVAIEYISAADLAAETIRLASRVSEPIAAVVGIPRSGLIPATILATIYQTPLYMMTANGPERIPGGRRDARLKDREGALLVVDDSAGSGWEIRRHADSLSQHRAITAAIYCLPEISGRFDYFGRALPSPHLFEWNLYGGPQMPMAALDLDGILCPDPPQEIRTAIEYEHSATWTLTAPPMHVPRNPDYPAAAIITARLEHDRAATESWLYANGARYQRLVMWPGKAGERTPQAVAAWKASEARKAGASFYVESCPLLADLIREAGMPTLCPEQKRLL